MDAEALLRIHMALECVTVNQAGDLIPVPCDNPDDIHRLYIARHRTGYSRFFRHDVRPDLRAALASLSIETLFHNHNQVKAIFADFGRPCPDMHIGKSYVYPEHAEAVFLSDITCQSEDDRCVMQVNDMVVSTCSSIRHNARSAEAWVFTHEDYRGQGFGKRVVQAWAQRIRQQGRIPFYSHRVDNPASQRLAKSLGFEQYIDDVGYE